MWTSMAEAWSCRTSCMSAVRALVLWRKSAARARCAISREALDDDFGADNRDKVEVFRETGGSSRMLCGRNILLATPKRMAPFLFTRANSHGADART